MSAAALPRNADAFLVGLLARFLFGTIGRAALGRGVARGAGAATRRRMDHHLASRLGAFASDIVLSTPVDGRYAGHYPDGAEVAVSRLPDRELVSLVCGYDSIPIVHPVQVQVMDNAAAKAAAQFGPAAGFELVYPTYLLQASSDWGLAHIHYRTIRGLVAITVGRSSPDTMDAVLRVTAHAPNGNRIRGTFHSRRVTRPMSLE